MIYSNKVVKSYRKPYDPTAYYRPPAVDKVEKEFRVVRDSHFNAEYIEVGERNVDEYIQSFANGCSLKAILDRCSLMPLNDKVRYLQQTESGFSADLTGMPSDGTEAFLMVQKVKKLCPDFAKRMRDGESFDSILTSLLPKAAAAESTPEAVKEDTSNG